MRRDVEAELVKWKEKEDRTPLIIRGARQVGKSFTIEEFGKKYFHNILVVNFEEKPEAKKIAGCTPITMATGMPWPIAECLS